MLSVSRPGAQPRTTEKIYEGCMYFAGMHPYSLYFYGHSVVCKDYFVVHLPGLDIDLSFAT